MSVAASCKLGTRWCCTPTDIQSFAKFDAHKSAMFFNGLRDGLSRDLRICKLSCCSSTSSRFSVSNKYNSLDSPDEKLLLTLMYDENPIQNITITIMVPADERRFKLKLDVLMWKLYLNYSDWRDIKSIIVNEIVPLLLKNAHLWISSRFMLSSNMGESFLKVKKSDQMIRDKVILPPDSEDASCLPTVNALNNIRCNEVILDIAILGVLDYKYEEVHTRHDLKALLHHMVSKEHVTAGMLRCQTALLLFKEKTRALEDYTHRTFCS